MTYFPRYQYILKIFIFYIVFIRIPFEKKITNTNLIPCIHLVPNVPLGDLGKLATDLQATHYTATEFQKAVTLLP